MAAAPAARQERRHLRGDQCGWTEHGARHRSRRYARHHQLAAVACAQGARDQAAGTGAGRSASRRCGRGARPVELDCQLFWRRRRWRWRRQSGAKHRDDQHFLGGLWPSVRAIAAHHDAVAAEAHQVAGEILVLEELSVAAVHRGAAAHGARVRLPVRPRAVQMAALAAPAERKAAHYLGLQDPLPRCAVPAGREEDHFRGRGCGKLAHDALEVYDGFK